MPLRDKVWRLYPHQWFISFVICVRWVPPTSTYLYIYGSLDVTIPYKKIVALHHYVLLPTAMQHKNTIWTFVFFFFPQFFELLWQVRTSISIWTVLGIKHKNVKTCHLDMIRNCWMKWGHCFNLNLSDLKLIRCFSDLNGVELRS